LSFLHPETRSRAASNGSSLFMAIGG